MAATASPFGLRPINLIGGQHYNGGATRYYKLMTNVSTAFYTGDVIQLSADGNPASISATPVAIKIPATSADATAGIVGVCVGVSYVDPTLKYQVFGQYLPANAITNGYTNVFIHVNDDPDQLYAVQAASAVGTLTNGARGAIGANAALGNFGGSATTGLSTINLVTGTNWGSVAPTSTLAMRIVDVLTPDDTYPELLVKFNVGVHSYTNSLGV